MNYRRLTRKYALKHGIDPDIFERQIGAESGFNPRAHSPAGARGIAQFMPATARGMGVNPDDPDSALDGAARLMKSYIRKYGSYRKALVAYNAGPGRVGKPLYAETKAYLSRILSGKGEPIPILASGSGRQRKMGRTSAEPEADEAREAILAALREGGKNPILRAAQIAEYSKVPAKARRRESEPDAPAERTKGKLGSKNAELMRIARKAQSMGLHVGENPRFGGVAPVHTKGSFHYSGRAIDVSGGNARTLKLFNRWVARNYGRRIKELFHDPGINIDNGRRTGAIGGHGSHVHVAV